MDTKIENEKTNGQAAQQTGYQNGDLKKGEAEQDMLYRLKGAIDQNGRYSYRLNDMAVGYAAATNTPTMSARHDIEQKFNAQFGATPHEYLERQFAQRDELRQENGNENKQSQSRGRSGGRGR